MEALGVVRGHPHKPFSYLPAICLSIVAPIAFVVSVTASQNVASMIMGVITSLTAAVAAYALWYRARYWVYTYAEILYFSENPATRDSLRPLICWEYAGVIYENHASRFNDGRFWATIAAQVAAENLLIKLHETERLLLITLNPKKPNIAFFGSPTFNDYGDDEVIRREKRFIRAIIFIVVGFLVTSGGYIAYSIIQIGK